MIHEASDSELRSAFRQHLERRAREEWAGQKNLKGKALRSFSFRDDEIDTCIVQFRALGLIRESVKQRSVRDTGTYWRLTPYGDHRMTQLRAIRREPEEPEEAEAVGVPAGQIEET